jgi:hypothetical protein
MEEIYQFGLDISKTLKIEISPQPQGRAGKKSRYALFAANFYQLDKFSWINKG